MIKADSLYRDTFNFLRNKYIDIVCITFIASLCTVLMDLLFVPDIQPLAQWMQNNLAAPPDKMLTELKAMVFEHDHLLIRAALAYTVVNLCGNALLVSTMVHFLIRSSAGKSVGTINVFRGALPRLPKLIVQLFLMTCLVQIGLSLLIVPGIMMIIYFALAPILLAMGNNTIFLSLKQSVAVTKKSVMLIASAILLWFVSKIVLSLLVSANTLFFPQWNRYFYMVLANLASAVLIILLYRCCMLAAATPKGMHRL